MSSVEEKCVICLESLEGDLRTLPCKHMFHTKCYADWCQRTSENTTSCPCCRAEHPDIVSSRPRSYAQSRSPPPLRRRRDNNRPIFIEPIDITGIDPRENLERAIRQRMNNAIYYNREPSMKELAVGSLLIGLVLLILYIFTEVHKECICNVKWDPGQTKKTETFFFGRETTYTRPDICTYVC